MEHPGQRRRRLVHRHAHRLDAREPREDATRDALRHRLDETARRALHDGARQSEHLRVVHRRREIIRRPRRRERQREHDIHEERLPPRPLLRQTAMIAVEPHALEGDPVPRLLTAHDTPPGPG